jgi:hypothetical protein
VGSTRPKGVRRGLAFQWLSPNKLTLGHRRADLNFAKPPVFASYPSELFVMLRVEG